MGIFGREQKTQRYLAGGKAVSCPTCGGTEFAKSEAQLHTAGLTFFQLEWLGKSAHVLVCDECGRIQWFAKPPEKVEND